MMHGCHDAINTKAKILHRFLVSQLWPVTILSSLQESRPEILRVGKREKGLQGYYTTFSLQVASLLKRLTEGIMELFIFFTPRSLSTYTIGKEGNLTGKMDLGEDTMTEYLLVALRMRLQASLELTVRRHMRLTGN